MKKFIFPLIMLTLFAAGCSNDLIELENESELIPLLKSSSRSIYVPNDFETIQEALDAAEEYDTIKISSGTYYGPLKILKSNICLVGQGENTKIILEEGPVTLEIINVENIEIKNLTIINQNSSGGVNIMATNLKDSRFLNLLMINDNTIYSYGFLMYRTENVRLSLCTLVNEGLASRGYGLAINSLSKSISVNSVKFENFNIGILNHGRECQFENNRFKISPDNQNTDRGGIIVNSSNCIIKNNSIFNDFSHPIIVRGSYNTIFNNNIGSLKPWLQQVFSGPSYEIEVYASAIGIRIEGSSNLIEGNKIKHKGTYNSEYKYETYIGILLTSDNGTSWLVKGDGNLIRNNNSVISVDTLDVYDENKRIGSIIIMDISLIYSDYEIAKRYGISESDFAYYSRSFCKDKYCNPLDGEPLIYNAIITLNDLRGSTKMIELIPEELNLYNSIFMNHGVDLAVKSQKNKNFQYNRIPPFEIGDLSNVFLLSESENK